jgi:hypothetical protein
MKNGLYAVSLRQGASTVLRVGWFVRDAGDPDEYETVWCTVYRPSTAKKLAEVWLGGPKTAPEFTWSAPGPSVAHRAHFQPLMRLDPKKWRPVVGPPPPGIDPE